jgi:diadenosine tetraphosphate (Ap4A) HIT family hydrolase
MDDWKRDRIGAALRGENPTVLARMPSGFAVIGDTQFLPGYCLLLRVPQVEHLTDLSREDRRQFLFDMSLLGEAVEAVCRPNGLRRVNYEILGNTDTDVHAHVIPRYNWEPAGRILTPVWLYPLAEWSDSKYAFSETAHGDLKRQIAAQLVLLMDRAATEP